MRRLGTLVAALTLLVSLAACAQPRPGHTGGGGSGESDREVARARFECLKEKGWPVRLEDGAILADVPQAQRDRYREDADECLRTAGVDPDATLSDQQLADVYASYVRIQKCLEDGGWSTPTRPSLDAFTSTYETAPWIPWSEVPGPDLPDAGKKCPAMMGGAG